MGNRGTIEFELTRNKRAQQFLIDWLNGDERNLLSLDSPIPPGANSQFIPMAGVTDSEFPVYGCMNTLVSGETGDYSTYLAICNQHIWLSVNSIDAETIATITGISVGEADAGPVVGDTEQITIDVAGNYQSYKKWLQLDSIVFNNAPTIDYDIGVIGYIDFGNQKRTIEGYRADVRTSSGLGDLAIEIILLHDLGDNKFNLLYLEKYGFDSTALGGEYVDEARGGVRDVSLDTQLAPIDRELGLKALDFREYFGDDRIAHGDEGGGLIVYFRGVEGGGIGGGISGIDHVTFTLYTL